MDPEDPYFLKESTPISNAAYCKIAHLLGKANSMFSSYSVKYVCTQEINEPQRPRIGVSEAKMECTYLHV